MTALRSRVFVGPLRSLPDSAAWRDRSVTGRPLRALAHHRRHGIGRGRNRHPDQLFVRLRWASQDVMQDLAAVPGMTDPQPQAPEPFRMVRENIAHAVVTTVAAAQLEPHNPGREIQLIVGHEDFTRANLVEARDTGQRPTAAVHVGHGLGQPHLAVGNARAGEIGLMARLVAEGRTVAGGELSTEMNFDWTSSTTPIRPSAKSRS